MHPAIILFDFLPHSWPLVMASNEPITPTVNRHHRSGSSTTIPQLNLSATTKDHHSVTNGIALTSTPAARGIISQQTASTREQIDPYLAEDFKTSRVYLPFEIFLQKVLNLPEDGESSVEFARLLGALEADEAYGQKLDTYLAASDGADLASTLYVYRQDPKGVIGTRKTENPSFCPDLTGVLHDLWLQSGNDEELVNDEGPKANFSWEQLILFLEYKKRAILVDRGIGAPTVLDANGLDPRDLTSLKRAFKKAQSASVTSTGATKRGSDSSKPAAKRQKSDPSKTPSRSDIQSSAQHELTFDDEADERKTVAYQCANYTLHFLSVGGFKDHSLGALICNDEIQLMYYDHSCIAISAPLNFRSDRRMFMLFQVCLYKTQQASLENRGGIIGRLFLEPSPYMRDYAKYQKVVGTDLDNILFGQSISLEDANGPFSVKLGRIIDRQAGLIGRCTCIVNAECDRWPGMKLAVKITWSPTDRKSEATFIDRIREEAEAQKADWVLDHVPNILHSQDFERLSDEVGGRLAAFLNDPATRYADGARFTYENRVLRVSVHEKLCKLSELGDVIDYAQVFFDILQVHRWIYDHARILHRDISQGNIMCHMRRGRFCGVLNDFDLSSFRDSTSPSSRQRTGTRPFMAREFHVNPCAPPVHLYRHDLESIFYVFFIIVVANALSETPTHDALAEEDCYLELDPFSSYGDWLRLDDYSLQTEKATLLKVRQPLTANGSFYALQGRVNLLHRALCAGFYAQDGHVKRVMDAMAPRHTLVSLRRRPAPSPARLPAVKEVELPTFDDSTLGGHWTYAACFEILSSETDFEELYPVACPDTFIPYV
ncbi:hypothetical protein BDZ89DRAFT_1076864 [Hymenopellis radicata]|nr:hypothetical protein BDZ89DRAFT_1076864 [Hymenopellis radicata]